MSKYNEALDVLERAQVQLIGEIATCGQAGGVGRAQNYAPVLVSVAEAIRVVKALLPVAPVMTPEQIRMAQVRAAKSTKQSDEG